MAKWSASPYQVSVLWYFFIFGLVVGIVGADTPNNQATYAPRQQHHHWAESHSKKIIIIFIIVVVVAVIAICLCFYYSRTQQQEPIAPAPAIAQQALAPAATIARQTLDIELFPVSTYTEERGVPFEATECHLCLMTFAEEQRLRTFPCQHCYHEDCISRFLSYGHSACPECRMDLSASTSS